jgi:hypothetical protein
MCSVGAITAIVRSLDRIKELASHVLAFAAICYFLKLQASKR